MKPTTSSINALIQGLKDGGCRFSTNYPGFNSHLIHQGLTDDVASINEKIAFERAYGASLAGNRSVVSVKGSGLNACADQFLHSFNTGVNAGLVIILSDDLEMVSSPESQDSRPYRDICGGLWLEPATPEDAYLFAYNSFLWSELLDQPIVIRLTNNYFLQSGGFIRQSPIISDKKIIKDRNKFLAWNGKSDRTAKRRQSVIDFVNSNTWLFIKKGPKKSEVTVNFGSFRTDMTAAFNVMCYPVPNDLREFLPVDQDIVVSESGVPYGKGLINDLLSHNVKNETLKEPSPLSSINTVHEYLPNLFSALRENDLSYLVADEGWFTSESTLSADTCLCMGSAIGIAIGLAEAGVHKPFALTGDGNFLHGGIGSLAEAAKRKISLGVIIIDNSVCFTSGGQKVAGDISHLLEIYRPDIIDYEVTSPNQLIRKINKMKNAKGLSVLIIKSLND